jgi:hypothetical protein
MVIGGFLFPIPMRPPPTRQQAQEKLEAEYPGEPWK